MAVGEAHRKKRSAREEGTQRLASWPSRMVGHPVAAFCLLALLATLIYSNTFSVPWQFDDKGNIVDNPRIWDLKNFLDLSGTRYVGYLSFALNYAVGGQNVMGYHVVNLLLHVTNAFLVYGMVQLLFRTPMLEEGRGRLLMRPTWIAAATAFLFVSHPIQTQAVTYVVQRLAALATLFYLLALICYLKWRLASPEAGQRSVWYVGALLATVLAMKTKENSFTLPVMVLLVEIVFFRSVITRRWAALMPFMLTLLIIPLSRQDVVAVQGREAGFAQETTIISRGEYLFTQFRVIITYLRLLILPVNQTFDYDYPLYHSLFDLPVFLSFLALCVLLGAAILLLMRAHRAADHAHRRLIAFGILWFFLTLSVESSIIPIRDVIFEHRLYLPSVGIFLALSAGMLGRYVEPSRPWRSPAWRIWCFGVIILVLSVATYQRNLIWRDPVTMTQDLVRKAPNKARAHNQLGFVYNELGRLKEAEGAYQNAIRIKPADVEAYVGLGFVYKAEGRLDDAIRAYQRAIELWPDHAEASYGLGNVYLTQKRYDDAIRAYQRAIELKPTHAEAYTNLGAAYYFQGRIEEAVQAYRRLSELHPERPDAYNNLGTAYRTQGRLDDAIRAYQRAIELWPDYAEAHYALGNTYVNLNRLDDAIRAYQRALETKSDYFEAHRSLGHILQRLGRIADARREHRRALEIKPDDEDVRRALASLPQ